MTIGDAIFHDVEADVDVGLPGVAADGTIGLALFSGLTVGRDGVGLAIDYPSGMLKLFCRRAPCRR